MNDVDVNTLAKLLAQLVREFGLLGAIAHLLGHLEQKAVELEANPATVLEAVDRHRAAGRAAGVEAAVAKRLIEEMK